MQQRWNSFLDAVNHCVLQYFIHFRKVGMKQIQLFSVLACGVVPANSRNSDHKCNGIAKQISSRHPPKGESQQFLLCAAGWSMLIPWVQFRYSKKKIGTITQGDLWKDESCCKGFLTPGVSCWFMAFAMTCKGERKLEKSSWRALLCANGSSVLGGS